MEDDELQTYQMSGRRMENCEGKFVQSLGSQGQALGLDLQSRGPLGGLDPEGAWFSLQCLLSCFHRRAGAP